jgi:hypothetical protein
MRGPGIGEMDKLVVLKAWEDMPSGFTLAQQYDDAQQAWASLVPAGSALFFGSVQVENAVTHQLITWRSGTVNAGAIGARHVVEHAGIRYRVKRASDMNGERAFVVIDLEQLGAIA